jgi:hypothetical protein
MDTRGLRSMRNRADRERTTAELRPSKELLRIQRTGGFLTFHEKERLKKEAESNRIKNLNKK